jgi:arylsulfatase A-like enzyme
VLIFLLDDIGYGDFGYLGSPYRGATPHLDAFAKRAVQLEMYAGAPICSPSRASLLSGRFSDAVGMWQLQEPGFGRMALRPDSLILGNVLARAGYATAAIG